MASMSSTSPKSMTSSAARIASGRVRPKNEVTSAESTFGAMPTQPTVLSTAHSSPSTDVPWRRESSRMVPWIRLALLVGALHALSHHARLRIPTDDR